MSRAFKTVLIALLYTGFALLASGTSPPQEQLRYCVTEFSLTAPADFRATLAEPTEDFELVRVWSGSSDDPQVSLSIYVGTQPDRSALTRPGERNAAIDINGAECEGLTVESGDQKETVDRDVLCDASMPNRDLHLHIYYRAQSRRGAETLDRIIASLELWPADRSGCQYVSPGAQQ